MNDKIQRFEAVPLLRGMTINRQSRWADQAVDISVSTMRHGRRHTSRACRVAMEDAIVDVLVSTVVSDLARELETEIMVYEKLEGGG